MEIYGELKKIDCRFSELYDEYSVLYCEMFKNAKKKVCRREFSLGGEHIHRGYYSPSFLDLVTGGLNRGSLLKKTSLNDYTYEYLFDDKDRLIMVNKFNDNFKLVSVELFVYNETVLSFVFEFFGNLNVLVLISECKYKNNELISYMTASCGAYDAVKGCNEINIEIPCYSDGMMSGLDWCRYSPSIQLLNHDKILFERDAYGELSTYTVEHISCLNGKIVITPDPTVYHFTNR